MARTTDDGMIVGAAAEMLVLVVIDPPCVAGQECHREVQFFPDWKSALKAIGGLTQGDDPGMVTILTMPVVAAE